nr:vitellogenin-like protein 1 [Sogatella furcifera]
MDRFVIIVLGLLIAGSASEEEYLFLPEHESVYAWNVTLTTGAALPQSVSLSWNFSANLHVQQTPGNTTIFKISDVMTSENHAVETRPLMQPFKATFERGLLTGLATEGTDKKWSVNMKRALVTLLQLDLASMGQIAFLSSESGMYGTCVTHYIVTNGDKKMTVQKILDMDSCSSLTSQDSHQWSSAPNFMCPNKYQKEVISHSERTYILDPSAKSLIQSISSKGKISLHPYQSQAEAHYSLISQSLDLIKVEKVDKLYEVDESAEETNLLWQPINLDPTYGKPPTNKSDVVLKEIQNMLGEVSDSLSWWKVKAQGLHNETLFRLVDLMWWLELEDWRTLYNTVTLGTSYRQETIQQIFWELVPEVGSSASTVFVKDLVRTSQVKGLNAVFLLGRLPFRLRNPTEELLYRCEDLLRLGDVGEEVKNSAILSFATMIYKTCAVSCKPDTVDRYTKLFLDRFKESTLHGDRMLYLQALCNMGLPQILDYLSPIIAGKTSNDRHLRFLATWAVIPSVFTDPGKVHEIFWPLLVNRTESLEIRVASLTLLILAKPTPAGLISLFWYMANEPSQQLYQFYYTTIQSLTQTTYPCYTQLGVVASQLARFVHPRSHSWATGNYILDYEEPDRGYGGLLQMLLIGSEKTGLPNVMIMVAEQHALGLTTEHAVYLKLEGLSEAMKHVVGNKPVNSVEKVLEMLQNIKAPDRDGEKIHFEFILKADGRTVMTYFMNETNFHNLTAVAKKLSSLYFEFSVNYQRLTFPLALLKHQPTDFGVTALSQVRFSSFMSARGRVCQDEEGAARNAELDLRYSWNGITSLRVFSPLSNTWYGADRSRSIHIRVPFATHITLNFAKSHLKIVAVKHRDFMAGSQMGGVWHSVTKLISGSTTIDQPHNITDEWTMDSEDLGARLGASVFDCPGQTFGNALHLLKRAFLAKNKNYHMLPGGVALLGLFSLKDQLAFQPPGGACGVLLSFVPLLTQVEPVLLLENNQLSLSMTRRDGLLWEIKAAMKHLHDGNKEAAFKLYHAPSISVSAGGFWRVIQLEGAFIIPSRKSGVFHPPAPITGYTFVSWGDAQPSNSDKLSVLDVKVVPGNNISQQSLCTDFNPICLQALTDLAARQTANVQYLNLPVWFKTAAHAVFPEHFQTESTSATFTFNSPVPFPWNTKGLCAVSKSVILTFDNATLASSMPEEYTLAVADCSAHKQFAILTKKVPESDTLVVRLLFGTKDVEIIPTLGGKLKFVLNGIPLSDTEFTQNFGNSSTTDMLISLKDNGMTEAELENGVVLQHYNSTIVVLVPGLFRSFTCGLCGDFNSDTNNDPIHMFTYIK